MKDKKHYRKPGLKVHGAIEELTRGSLSGGAETTGKQKGKPGT